MMKFKGTIRLCITFLGFFACLSGVSAADVSIDNNTWTIGDIQDYFNGNMVHELCSIFDECILDGIRTKNWINY